MADKRDYYEVLGDRHKQYAKQRCKYKSKHYKEYYAYDL